MAVQHDRDVVVVSDRGGQFVEHRVGDRVDGQFDGLRHHLGDAGDSGIDRFVTPLDEPVGVEQQGRSGGQCRGGLWAGFVSAAPPAAPSAHPSTAAAATPARRAPRGRVRRCCSISVSDRVSRMATNTVVQNASGMKAATESSCSSSVAGSAPVSSSARAEAAQLTHHRGRGQAATDTVADDDADAVVADGQHVVPVAADFQRRHRGLVPHGEARRQFGRREHRALQRQRRVTGELELADMLHRQAEVSDKGGDELPVLRADPAGLTRTRATG